MYNWISQEKRIKCLYKIQSWYFGEVLKGKLFTKYRRILNRRNSVKQQKCHLQRPLSSPWMERKGKMVEDEIRNIHKYQKLWRAWTFIKYRWWRVTGRLLNMESKSPSPTIQPKELSQMESSLLGWLLAVSYYGTLIQHWSKTVWITAKRLKKDFYFLT